MLKNLFKIHKGFTLVELIVVMAIMGIVSTIIYSMNLFGMKSFAMGESKSNAQLESRMALDFITKEVRYANEVNILPSASTIPAIVSDNYCYIYSLTNGTSQEIRYKDKSVDKLIASFTTENLTFSTTNNKILRYDLTGVYKGESFSIYSDVLPLNLTATIVNSNGVALKYLKASATAANTLTFQALSYPGAFLNEPYTQYFTTSGGVSPYTYTLTTGTLPDGINLDSSSGTLSGTPITPGQYSFTLKVTDSSSPGLSASLSLSGYVIDNSGSNQPPVASNVAITGISKVGETLIGTFDYSDYEGDSQGTDTYKWYEADTVNSTKTLISGATGNTYTVLSTDLNKYIFFEVTPVATSGTTQGIPVVSSPVLIVTNLPPTITDVMILVNGSQSKTAKVGDTLTVQYSYSDTENDTKGIFTYQWIKSNGNGNSSLIGTADKYIVNSDDKNKSIYVEVTPTATSGVSPGVTVTTTSIDISKN